MPHTSPQRKIVAWFQILSGCGSVLLALGFLLIGESQSAPAEIAIGLSMYALYAFIGYGLLIGFKYFWEISLAVQILEIFTIQDWWLNLGYHVEFTFQNEASGTTYGINLTAILFCYLLAQAKRIEQRHSLQVIAE